MNTKLKIKLMERNRSQISLCFELGLTEASFSRIIRGWTTPREETKARIANVLGCKVEEIF